MLWYLCLEPYEERYTMQLSGPGGWFERACNRHGIEFTAIRPRVDAPAEVKTGIVLDAHGRCLWALAQCSAFVELMRAGAVKDGDVIYIEDMMHPGCDCIPYIAALQGLRVRTFSRCFAQSVDPHDFTFPMRGWMRHYERGHAAWQEAIFVASQCHVDMMNGGGVGGRVVCTGQPFDEEEVRGRTPKIPMQKEKLVVFPCRWDWEKQPWFFLEVARWVHRADPHIQFIACTSRPESSVPSQRVR